MSRKLILLFFILNIVSVRAADIRSDAETVIHEVFGPEVELEVLKITIEKDVRRSIEKTVKQKFFGDYVYLWHICDQDSVAGIAILDNVYGKSLPITFLTLFNANGDIRKVQVIRYREPYGGAVRSEKWLDQFAGHSDKQTFAIDQGIDSISGATISSRSMTRGIRKLTLLFRNLVEYAKTPCPEIASLTNQKKE